MLKIVFIFTFHDLKKPKEALSKILSVGKCFVRFSRKNCSTYFEETFVCSI